MTATLQIPEKPITLMQAAQLLADAVCPDNPYGVRAWLNLLLAKAHSGEIQGRLSLTLAPLDTTGILPADYAEQAVLTPSDLRRVATGSDLLVEEGCNQTAMPAPVVTENASNVPGSSKKVWTPEKLAEVKAYREKHGTKKAAQHYGVSEQRIRKLLPGNKPKAKGYSAFTCHMR